MAKPWEQRGKEPDRWYGRFELYLFMGSERSLEAAYRAFLERAQTGEGPVHRPPPRRMPGSWQDTARKWEWTARARSYDADERARVRKAHFDAVKKSAQRHQALLGSQLNAAIKQVGAIDWSKVTSPAAFVPLVIQLIRADREVMGAPIHIEFAHKQADHDGSAYDEAAIAASAEAGSRFEATAEMYVAAAQVLEAQEVARAGGREDAAPTRPPAPGTAIEQEDASAVQRDLPRAEESPP